MKHISLETTVKEIKRNPKLYEVCNSVSNNMFSNPALAQAETMSISRLAAMMGPNGEAMLSSVVAKVNDILDTLPDEEFIDPTISEIENSKGLEASISEEERNSHKKENTCITPGKVWYDTDGNRIQAHGASVYFENGTYYWIGENKDHTTKEGEIWTWGVKIYSSKDLYNWTDEGFIIEPNLKDPTSVFYPVRRLDRPHLLYNEKTKKYVLWLKYCDNAHFTVLNSDSLMGPYAVIHEVYNPFGTNCGDFDLAKDETTGKAYLYWEVNHTDVWGSELIDDYTGVGETYVKIYKDMQSPYTREAVCHILHNGRHYLVTSGMTGYVPNPSEVAISDDWLNGYKVQGNPHVDDNSCSSFNSQISHIFKVDGKDKFIAIADRWVPEFVVTKEKYDIIVRVITSRTDKNVKVTDEEKAMFVKMPMMGSANTSIANYVWLPIEFNGETLNIRWYDEWTV